MAETPSQPLGDLLKAIALHAQKATTLSSDEQAAEEERKDFAEYSKEIEDPEDHERKLKRQIITRRNLENLLLDDLIKTRKEYSKKIFTFLVWWSSGVGAVIVIQGFGFGGFSLPESVLDFLVGSTTANVIALVGLVVKGLFPSDVKD